MAGALVRGIVQSGIAEPGDVIITDIYPATRQALAAETGVREADSNAACVAAADIVFLCVKPGDFKTALAACGDGLGGKLLVSILAGVSLDVLTQASPAEVRVVRAMPNTPAMVGASATVFAASRDVTQSDRDSVSTIFRAVGNCAEVPESAINAVTGLSGSGPAYVFLIIEALTEGGVHAGLPRALAQDLAVQTVFGAGKLAKESAEHPAVLREMVTSPGGTTAAGLGVLESSAVRSAVIGAVRAAAERSRELGA